MFDRTSSCRNSEAGFTLVEVLMSIVIMMIGFVAVFGMVAVSDRTLQKSRGLSELNAIGNDVIESVVSDRANLMEYVGQNLKNCSGIVTSSGKTDQLERLRRWCNQMNGVAGEGTTNDTRIIRVKNHTISSQNIIVLTVELTAGDGNHTFFAKRILNAP